MSLSCTDLGPPAVHRANGIASSDTDTAGAAAVGRAADAQLGDQGERDRQVSEARAVPDSSGETKTPSQLDASISDQQPQPADAAGADLDAAPASLATASAAEEPLTVKEIGTVTTLMEDQAPPGSSRTDNTADNQVSANDDPLHLTAAAKHPLSSRPATPSSPLEVALSMPSAQAAPSVPNFLASVSGARPLTSSLLSNGPTPSSAAGQLQTAAPAAQPSATSSQAPPASGQLQSPSPSGQGVPAYRGPSRQADERPPSLDGELASFSVLGAEGALDVVADALPNVLPNVLINKREGVCS